MLRNRNVISAIGLLILSSLSTSLSAEPVAPKIIQFPAVIIGDSGDVDTSETQALHLLRYVNLVNLDSITSKPNSGDSSKLRFWYETTGQSLRVTNSTALKQPLTPSEVLALKSDTPTTPPLAKEITGGSDFWASLIQDTKGNVTGGAKNATVAANGDTTESLTAAGALGNHWITIYAIDEVLTSGTVGQMMFDVYSLLQHADRFSPDKPHLADFEGNTDGWVFYDGAPEGFAAGTQAASSTALGVQGSPFTPSATIMGRFASWFSPLQVVPADAMNGYYYRCTIEMTGNAATAAAAPGYRFLYLSTAYVHLGGIQATSPSTGASTTFVSPYIGHPRTMHVAWTVPVDLVGYDDAGVLNKSTDPDNDLRTYALQFDLFQMDATDSGAIFLEDVLVEKAPRPLDAIPARDWGGTGVAFSDKTTGWVINNLAPSGIQPALAGISSTSMTLSLSGTNTDGFRSLVPCTAAGLPFQTAGKMLRTTYRLSSSDPARTPSLRYLHLGTTNAWIDPIYWGDMLNYALVRSYATPAESPAGIPGSYKSGAGSKLEFYAPGQYAGTGYEQAHMTPQVDLFELGSKSYPRNGWQRPAATVTISNIKMEMLDEPWRVW